MRWVPVVCLSVGLLASDYTDSIQKWQKESPASPDNLRRTSGLPPKSKNMARARLREGAAELSWPGGRAGTKG